MRGIARPGRRLPLAAALLALACAKMGPPPGGPPDQVAPRLIARFPDSSEVLPNFRADAEFTFDEVISEGTAPNFGLGNGTLESLILLSPSDEVPVVRWRRDRITVRPREGWQNGRVYRIELRPGVADLRTNRLDQPAVITFTTGAVQPRTVLRGTVVDWTSRRPQAGGIVEAILMPDSLSYRSVADSTGAFTLGPLPAGEYLVYAGVDQNRNFRVDAREIFDSVRVAAGEETVGEIWAFRHDS
ncbi:MAG: Ig-like domain-containing protein, partial [Gemmatimonadales bacterium]|nr:Ig-like domain-containing protein [Gemmatimonadales bacterium]